MNILSFLWPKNTGREKMNEVNAVTNQNVRDKKSEMQRHVRTLKVGVKILHDQIGEAKKTSVKIQRMLTMTEATLRASGK